VKAPASAASRRPLPYFAEPARGHSSATRPRAGSSARPLLPADVDDEREPVISRSPRDKHGGAEHRCLTRMESQRSRQALFDRVGALHREGRSVSDIVRQTGFDRRTIAKWIRADALPLRNAAAPKTTSPRYFEEYLSRRWSEVVRAAGVCSKRSRRAAIRAVFQTSSGCWGNGGIQNVKWCGLCCPL